MSTHNLLVELFVEELPPKALKKLGEAFAGTLAESLKTQGLAGADSVVTPYASPRRLAVHVTNVSAQAADKPVSHKLMPVSVGLDANGQATPALLKKLGALGLDASVVPQLKRAPDGKAEALFFDSTAKGALLADGLQKALDEAIAKLPIPKVMTYQLADGWSTVNFVRPVHGLVALHGAEVVNIGVLGLSAGRTTQGHRFEAKSGSVGLKDADSYAAQMESEGAVIPSYEVRCLNMIQQLLSTAKNLGLQLEVARGLTDAEAEVILPDNTLIQEVTALVERPNVLVGRFEQDFLAVPQECLILTMKANQKYFPLLDAAGKLSNQFLIVSNISPADASQVVSGNERVVRPRLADAKFFFDQDRKQKLAARVPRLDNVVYHNKLGSQGERVKRLVKLAGGIARLLKADEAQAERAALLAKADLLTDMVGEFPELQGIMGRYYALHDGEALPVADAVETHYQPRFAGDALPEGNVALSVALADRLDSLVGIFGIGLAPTGDKDPFALRRAALGVLRILMECGLPLDLLDLLELARTGFAPGQVADSVALDVYPFMLERLRGLLREVSAVDEVEAVLVQQPRRIDRVPARLAAVREFRALPEAEALAAANKRIQNILKKTEVVADAVEAALLQEGAERALYEQLLAVRPKVEAALANLDYTAALKALAGLRAAVDRFFDEVMVMVDEPLVRNNRLALLTGLAATMNSVADIGQLSSR
ncbi:MAG: glycine--tRNA ligase subunit beta [Betaproteobacteria bacterium]|nr:glycine--tRNA ligase subunit beta [Betaproteobacteria bacterium]